MSDIDEIQRKIEAAETVQASIREAMKTAADSANAAVEAAKAASSTVEEHANNMSAHFSIEDRTNFNHFIDLLNPVADLGSIVTPDEAIPAEWFASYFARNAQPGTLVAPGNVFVSRVPFAYQDEQGNWHNTGSAIDTTQIEGENPTKLLDNKGLIHQCSTDTQLGVDDYVGKKWAFYWNRCNYIKDSYGVKWVSAIEGEVAVNKLGGTAIFNPKKPTGVFGPAIWAFCTLDKSYGVAMVNGVETPSYQLWGIGDSPWNKLSDHHKEELEKLGVSENDYHPWRTSLYYKVNEDGSGEWAWRPYILDSAYCGTAELSDSGELVGISSKVNEPLAQRYKFTNYFK